MRVIFIDCNVQSFMYVCLLVNGYECGIYYTCIMYVMIVICIIECIAQHNLYSSAEIEGKPQNSRRSFIYLCASLPLRVCTQTHLLKYCVIFCVSVHVCINQPPTTTALTPLFWHPHDHVTQSRSLYVCEIRISKYIK